MQPVSLHCEPVWCASIWWYSCSTRQTRLSQSHTPRSRNTIPADGRAWRRQVPDTCRHATVTAAPRGTSPSQHSTAHVPDKGSPSEALSVFLMMPLASLKAAILCSSSGSECPDTSAAATRPWRARSAARLHSAGSSGFQLSWRHHRSACPAHDKPLRDWRGTLCGMATTITAACRFCDCIRAARHHLNKPGRCGPSRRRCRCLLWSPERLHRWSRLSGPEGGPADLRCLRCVPVESGCSPIMLPCVCPVLCLPTWL